MKLFYTSYNSFYVYHSPGHLSSVNDITAAHLFFTSDPEWGDVQLNSHWQKVCQWESASCSFYMSSTPLFSTMTRSPVLPPNKSDTNAM